MKKLIMMLMVVATAFCAKAVAVDWSYETIPAEEGYTVYLFSAAVEAKYDTFADLTATSIANAKVVAKTSRGKTTYSTGAVQLVQDSLADSLYAVVVSGADATEYAYGSFSTAGLIYNPANQETSPGVAAIPALANKGTIGNQPGPTPVDTPEPTSGLLLLVGGAALALRRKQK